MNDIKTIKNDDVDVLALPSVSLFAQFSIYYVKMDKPRPAIILTNNWFNVISDKILVAGITSVSPNNEKEYNLLKIPFSSIFKKINYVKLNNIRMVTKEELFNSKYLGMLMDQDAQYAILNMLEGIFSPGFNKDHLSLAYIENISNTNKYKKSTNSSDNRVDLRINNDISSECDYVGMIKNILQLKYIKDVNIPNKYVALKLLSILNGTKNIMLSVDTGLDPSTVSRKLSSIVQYMLNNNLVETSDVALTRWKRLVK